MIEVQELFFKNHFPCPECGAVIIFNEEMFDNYFRSKDVFCDICGIKLDIWNIFKVECKQGHIFGFHYSLLGCVGRTKKITLKPMEIFELDLSDDIGDGELLYRNYTPYGDGDLFPTEVHGNTPEPHIRQKKIVLYGRPLSKDAKETEINILYWYSPSEFKDDIGMTLILDAFQRYHEKNYRYMVISASTAVEVAQTRFFTELLKSSGIGSSKIESFLTQQATFSPQLKVLLPLLADKLKFPKMKMEIYDGLLNLRNDRNDVVHEGVPENGWKNERIETELISALFAFKYYRMVSKITAKPDKK